MHKLKFYILTFGFFIFVIVLIAYSFITKEKIIPANILYEKNQDIVVSIPHSNTVFSMKYAKAVGGENYVKLIDSKTLLKKNGETFKVLSELVLTTPHNFEKFSSMPILIFPTIRISDYKGNILKSGFSFLKSDFLFFDRITIAKNDNLSILSDGGEKIGSSLYLEGLKIIANEYRLSSYNKIIYSEKNLKAVNVFMQFNTGIKKISGFIKKFTMLLDIKNQYIGKFNGINFDSTDFKFYGNMSYFEQKNKTTIAYFLNGVNLKYYDFNLQSYYNTIVTSYPKKYIQIFLPMHNVITSNNMSISGKNMKLKKTSDKLYINSRNKLKINISGGNLYSNNIVFYPDRKRYKLASSVIGYFNELIGGLELMGRNLNIKESNNTVRLYSKNPIVFRTKENIIKAYKATYNKVKKQFTFEGKKFYVCVKKLTSVKIRIFAERLKIGENNIIRLSNKFIVEFLEKGGFESFSGIGNAIISGSKIDMIGKLYIKLFAKEPFFYTSTRQYINLNKNSINGYSKNNVFFYSGSKFFADSAKFNGTMAHICNMWGINIKYLYNIKIHSKCIKYYIDKDKIVFPKGSIKR